MTREEWLIHIVNASLLGGKEILEVYNAHFSVGTKSDNSPITEADKRAHYAICKALAITNIPILSEEGIIPNYEYRKNWKQFWLVDPLDGTKEFVNKNGEFTVNIALIENGKPTMGVIYIPVTKELYFSDKKAFKCECFTQPAESIVELLKKAKQLPLQQNKSDYIILGSRSHITSETKAFIKKQKEKYSNVNVLKKGSSLKFCLIAEGNGDIYPRFGPTMEWDTAAGHAIMNAAEKEVTNLKSNKPLTYNKQNLLNPWFIAK